MNFRVKVILQIFGSLMISYILLVLTYSAIKDINSKFTFTGVVKVTDYPSNSKIVNTSSFKNSIAIYFYEAREEIIYGDIKNSSCNKLNKKLKPINVTQNKAGYFIIQLMSVENEKILFECFGEFLGLIDQKFNKEIKKLEDELIYKNTKPEIIEQFFKNENLPNIESLNEEAQLFLFQQKTSFLLQERLESLEFSKYINILKSEGPTSVIRTGLEKQTLNKNNYFILLFFGTFSILFLIFNHKDLGYSKQIKKLIKIIDIKS